MCILRVELRVYSCGLDFRKKVLWQENVRKRHELGQRQGDLGSADDQPVGLFDRICPGQLTMGYPCQDSFVLGSVFSERCEKAQCQCVRP